MAINGCAFFMWSNILNIQKCLYKHSCLYNLELFNTFFTKKDKHLKKKQKMNKETWEHRAKHSTTDKLITL